MKIIKAGYEILSNINGNEILKAIEIAGRTCYKSESKITDESAIDFVKKLIERGHEAMIEHQAISVKFICDRGVSHEIVRHRIASFAQESTRYCDYTKSKFDNHVVFIQPNWFDIDITGEYATDCQGLEEYSTYLEAPEDIKAWMLSMVESEDNYKALRSAGWAAQQARSVLPNSLKTEIVVTMNLREWRHFFKLRTAPAAHPQMREITIPLLSELQGLIPVIFDGIEAGE